MNNGLLNYNDGRLLQNTALDEETTAVLKEMFGDISEQEMASLVKALGISPDGATTSPQAAVGGVSPPVK